MRVEPGANGGGVAGVSEVDAAAPESSSGAADSDADPDCAWSSSDGQTWSHSTAESHARWYFDSVPDVGIWATNSDGPGGRIWFSPDGVHWEKRAGG